MSTLFDFFTEIEDKRDPKKIKYPLSMLGINYAHENTEGV